MVPQRPLADPPTRPRRAPDRGRLRRREHGSHLFERGRLARAARRRGGGPARRCAGNQAVRQISQTGEKSTRYLGCHGRREEDITLSEIDLQRRDRLLPLRRGVAQLRDLHLALRGGRAGGAWLCALRESAPRRSAALHHRNTRSVARRLRGTRAVWAVWDCAVRHCWWMSGYLRWC